MIKTIVEYRKGDPSSYRKFVVHTFRPHNGLYITSVHEYHNLTEYSPILQNWRFVQAPANRVSLTQECAITHGSLVGRDPKDVRIILGQKHLAACLEILNEDSLYHNTI